MASKTRVWSKLPTPRVVIQTDSRGSLSLIGKLPHELSVNVPTNPLKKPKKKMNVEALTKVLSIDLQREISPQEFVAQINFPNLVLEHSEGTVYFLLTTDEVVVMTYEQWQQYIQDWFDYQAENYPPVST